MMIFSSVRTKYHSFLWYLANKGITPNQVTIGRTLMFLIVIILWMIAREYQYSLVLIVLIIISLPIWLLDMVDGDLARITKQMTDMGKWLDPLADKVKFYLAMLAFSFDLYSFEYTLVFLMFLLDLFSTFIRKFQLPENKGANSFGKIKLCFQVFAIILYALYIYAKMKLEYYIYIDYIHDFAEYSLMIAILLGAISVTIRFFPKKESIF